MVHLFILPVNSLGDQLTARGLLGRKESASCAQSMHTGQEVEERCMIRHVPVCSGCAVVGLIYLSMHFVARGTLRDVCMYVACYNITLLHNFNNCARHAC